MGKIKFNLLNKFISLIILTSFIPALACGSSFAYEGASKLVPPLVSANHEDEALKQKYDALDKEVDIFIKDSLQPLLDAFKKIKLKKGELIRPQASKEISDVARKLNDAISAINEKIYDKVGGTKLAARLRIKIYLTLVNNVKHILENKYMQAMFADILCELTGAFFELEQWQDTIKYGEMTYAIIKQARNVIDKKDTLIHEKFKDVEIKVSYLIGTAALGLGESLLSGDMHITEKELEKCYQKAAKHFANVHSILSDDPYAGIYMNSLYALGTVKYKLKAFQEAYALFSELCSSYRMSLAAGSEDMEHITPLIAVSRAYMSLIESYGIWPKNLDKAFESAKEAQNNYDWESHANLVATEDNEMIIMQMARARLARLKTFSEGEALAALEELSIGYDKCSGSDSICRFMINICVDLYGYYKRQGKMEMAEKCLLRAMQLLKKLHDIAGDNAVEIYRALIQELSSGQALGKGLLDKLRQLGPDTCLFSTAALVAALYHLCSDAQEARSLLKRLVMSSKGKAFVSDPVINILTVCDMSYLMKENIIKIAKDALQDMAEKDIKYKERLIELLLWFNYPGTAVFLDNLLRESEPRPDAHKDFIIALRKGIAKLEERLNNDDWLERINNASETSNWQSAIVLADAAMKSKNFDLKRQNEFTKAAEYSQVMKAQQVNLDTLYKKAINEFENFRFEPAIAFIKDALAINPADKAFTELLSKIENMIIIRQHYWEGSFKIALEEINAMNSVKYSRGQGALIKRFKDAILDVIKAQDLIEGVAPEAAIQILNAKIGLFENDKENYPGLMLDEALEKIEFAREAYRQAEAAKMEWDIGRLIELSRQILTSLNREDVSTVRLLISCAEDAIVSNKFSDAKGIAAALLSLVKEDFSREPNVHSRAKTFIRQATAGELLEALQIEKVILEAWLAAVDNANKRAGGVTSWSFSKIENTYKGFVIRNIQAITKDGRIMSAQNLKDIPLFKGESYMFSASGKQINGQDKQAGRYFKLVAIEKDSLEFEFDDADQIQLVRAFISVLEANGGQFKAIEDIATVRQIERLNSAISLATEVRQKGKSTQLGLKLLAIALGIEDAQDINASAEIAADKIKNSKLGNDPSQKLALEAMLDPAIPVTFVHGPPGTGKTSVIVEAVRQFIDKGKKVLILSQSNTAVNNVGERLLDNEGRPLVPFVRLGNNETVISEKIRPFWSFNNNGQPVNDVMSAYKPNRKGFAVLGTLNGFLNDRIVRQKMQKDTTIFDGYDVVIIEEAGRATVAETMVGIGLAKSKIIFVGDPKQLPPHGIGSQRIEEIQQEVQDHGLRLSSGFDTIFSQSNVDSQKISLFERRLVDREMGTGLDYRLLRVNRRSLWPIAMLVNKCTYEGMLLHEDENKPRKDWKAQEADTYLAIDTAQHGFSAQEEKLPGGSYRNMGEVSCILQAIDLMLNQTIVDSATGKVKWRYNTNDIFVISAYSAQIKAINDALRLKAELNEKELQALLLAKDDQQRARELLKEVTQERRSKSRFYNLESLGPRRLTTTMLDDIGFGVLTVDSVQGHENKVELLSLVRSHKTRPRLGFYATKDGRQRLNVAISRAQEKLIVFGDFGNTLTSALRSRRKAHEQQYSLVEKTAEFFAGMMAHYEWLISQPDIKMPSFAEQTQFPEWYRNEIARMIGTGCQAGIQGNNLDAAYADAQSSL